MVEARARRCFDERNLPMKAMPFHVSTAPVECGGLAGTLADNEKPISSWNFSTACGEL